VREPACVDVSVVVEHSRAGSVPRPLGGAQRSLQHTGAKRLHHPVIGDLTLNYQTMQLPAGPGLTMAVYTAEPGSPSPDALNLLASWAATADRTETGGEVRQT